MLIYRIYRLVLDWHNNASTNNNSNNNNNNIITVVEVEEGKMAVCGISTTEADIIPVCNTRMTHIIATGIAITRTPTPTLLTTLATTRNNGQEVDMDMDMYSNRV